MSETAAQRKLTTILAADVVDYSQMMSDDEEATLKTFRAYRDVTDGLVAKHNGRVFSTAGDAFLAEFGSAVEAVRCAISIQEDLAVRNAELSDERQMWFRIGINVGDVMVEGDDLFGDGVNVAARLEGLAEKGGICISGSTFDQVKRKLSIAFVDIGARKVKNIPEPIPAFRIVPGKVAFSDRHLGAAADARDRRTLVKMTFTLAAVAAVLLAGAYIAGLFPSGRISDHLFDGHWKVTVDSLSGCLDNSAKSYSITVQNSKIDEPQHPLPKSGEITPEGDVRIKVTNRAGSLRNTQIVKITGDVGEGSFQGSKPGCAGMVTMVRLD